MNKIATIILYLLFFPLFLSIDIIKSTRSIFKKIAYFLIVLVFLFSWFSFYKNMINYWNVSAYDLGLTDKGIKVPVVGDSMLPTIKSRSEVILYNPKKYKIERGDIVSFRNDITWPSYFLKRVIGMPGDNILIKNGKVLINKQPLKEDYVLNKLPTYGNEYLNECKTYKIPENQYMVMGDNRTVSYDSRAIGFIDRANIDGIIKSEQKVSFQDQPENSRPNQLPNADKLTTIVNTIRVENGLYPLVKSEVLNTIAAKRVEGMKRNFNSWKEDMPTIDQLLTQYRSNYIQNREFITYGNLTEEEIIGQIKDQPDVFMDYFSNTYTDFGFAVDVVKNEECSFPVIVFIVARPQNPNYQQETIRYWLEQERQNKAFIENLNSFKGYPGLDDKEWDYLLSLTNEAYSVSSEINRQIRNGVWIDETLIKKYADIINTVNPRITKFFEKGLTAEKPGLGSANSSKKRLNCTNKGLVTIEGDTTAKIIDTWTENNKIKITVSFSNSLGITASVAEPYLLTMQNSKGSGTFPEPAVSRVSLRSGETVVYDFSYKELPDAPYIFTYLNQEGKFIELARCKL